MKIQHRIALIFSFITISIVLVVSAVEYYFANQNTFEDFYKRLEIRAIITAKSQYQNSGSGRRTYEELRKQHLEPLPNELEYFLPVDALEHSVKISGLKLDEQFYRDAIKYGEARHRDHDIFYLGYLHTETSGKYIVVVSARNVFIDAYLNNLRNILLISIVSTVVLSIFVGLWFSKIILRPTRLITRRMQEITATQLHLRLATGKGHDEMEQLSETFNNMLDRLEATFETQKNFISNASHELNTPLTTIIGESEFALSRNRSAEEYSKAMTVILAEAERLKRITNSLLHLAQTGYTANKQEFTYLRLDEIIYMVKKTVDNIIPNNKAYVNLSLMPEDAYKLRINGNEQLLELAFVNLVINGCKYSGNKPVRITMAASHGKAIVVIEDEGVGIPKDEIAYIYEPFFRASNTGKFNGYGIGMPLSRNIIRMHGGELEVTSEQNVGTKIKVSLPQCTGL